MGRHTYEVGTTMGIVSPYSHLEQYVVSSTLVPTPEAPVTVICENPVAAVRALKRRDGRNIWLCGGAMLAATLMDEIDELVLKINPVILGAGIPLFRRDAQPVDLRLIDARTFDGGVAIHRYRPVTDGADEDASHAADIRV